MIVSRKITDQYNILNNITGYPDCVMSISQLLSLRQNANAVVLYPLIVNGIIRYEFTPLIISQNTSNIYLLDNNASGSLPTNFYDGTIAYSDVMTPTDSSMFCYNTNLNRFEERGISITSFIRNNIGYRYYNLSDTSGLEGVIYIPDWIENIYINDNLQLPFVNATEEIYKIGTPSGLIDISKYNDDYPVGSVAYNDWQNYVVPGNYISIDSWTPQTIVLKYGRIEFGSDGYGYINIKDNNGNIIAEQHGILTWLAGNKIYIIAGICEEEQRGRIGVFIEPPSYTATGVGWNSRSVDRKAYEFITQNALGATVTISYALPQEETYNYAMITYKKDTRPINQNDGDSVNINTSLSYVDVTGLDEGSDYWFTIYTDKSESESFPYTVGDVEVAKNALIYIGAKYGNRDVKGHTINEENASRVSNNGEYFYMKPEDTAEGSFDITLNKKFTGDLDLWFETECYIGDEDYNNQTLSNCELGMTLLSDLSNWQSRIWQVCYRNCNYDTRTSARDYDYWYNNKQRNCLTPMDDHNYANKWTKVAIKTEIRNSRITRLISYRNGVEFRTDSEGSSKDISNITFPYFRVTFPVPESSNPQYVTYRAKYFKLWVEEV